MTISTPEQLEQSFYKAEAEGSETPGAIRRRLLPESSLNVFTEVRFPTREWALLVHSAEELEDRDLVLASGLTCRTRTGSVEVVASPETDRFLFCTLLADLVRQLHVPTATPTSALVRRLNAWRKMLDRGLPTGLTPEARVGLFGELMALRDVLLPAIGSAGITAWVGPSGAPKDFVHFSAALEVKTVSRRDSSRCRISSEHQLDVVAGTDLYLVHQVVAGSQNGASLADVVDELRGDPRVQHERVWFENCLLEAGWLDAHRDQYVNDRYALSRRQFFRVGEGFPRLTSSDLPSGVSGVTYIVDLSDCGSYRVDERSVQSSVAQADKAEG
ncbi:PD-(D/E)XK motif protein [Streptomyces erythrochromogenes]|uniref:PD-(D/E)XK motif protein n=1 Tax=Streptomyces erythrochromogenes TaxID=285574 RepID=UPI003693D9E9